MKKLSSLLIVMILLFTFFSCSNNSQIKDAEEIINLNTSWIIGKSKSEIEKEYGEFVSYVDKGVFSYGEYEGKVRINGGNERYTNTVIIRFNIDGIADKVYKARPPLR